MKGNVGISGSSPCAELPNDNPALHGGVIWVCLTTTGSVSAIPPEHRVENDDDRVTIPAVVESGIVTASMREDDATSLEALAAAVGVVIAPAPSGIMPGGVANESAIVLADAEDDDDDDLIVVEELPPLDLVEVEGPGIAKTNGLRVETIAPPPAGDAWTAFVSALADVAIGAGSPYAASLITGLLVDASIDALPPDLAATLADVVQRGQVTHGFRAKVDAWRGIVRGTSEDFSSCGDTMLDEWAADLLARLVGGTTRAATLKRELRERGVAAFGFAAAA